MRPGALLAGRSWRPVPWPRPAAASAAAVITEWRARSTSRRASASVIGAFRPDPGSRVGPVDPSDQILQLIQHSARLGKQRGRVFTREGQRMLPLYESKMAHHFDHRWNSFYGTGNDDRHRLTFAEKQDPSVQAEPRYWILEDGLIRPAGTAKTSRSPAWQSA